MIVCLSRVRRASVGVWRFGAMFDRWAPSGTRIRSRHPRSRRARCPRVCPRAFGITVDSIGIPALIERTRCALRSRLRQYVDDADVPSCGDRISRFPLPTARGYGNRQSSKPLLSCELARPGDWACVLDPRSASWGDARRSLMSVNFRRPHPFGRRLDVTLSICSRITA